MDTKVTRRMRDISIYAVIIILFGCSLAATALDLRHDIYLWDDEGNHPNDYRNSTGPAHPDPGNWSQELVTESNNVVTMSVPMVIRGFDADVTDHFTMVPNITKVVVNISGERPDWQMGYSMGVGEDPDNGTARATCPGGNGQFVYLEYTPGKGCCEEGRWFVFIQINDPDKHRGEDNKFLITVMVYTPWLH